MAPAGFDSVCGTELNQQVLPVQMAAAEGDAMAKTLLDKGDVYGKQFVVFETYQAYPTYVVTYVLPKDSAISLMRQRSMQVADQMMRVRLWLFCM